MVTGFLLLLQNFTFPEHVGFPLGEKDSPGYMLLEMHYDNPKEESGKDRSLLIFLIFFALAPFSSTFFS